MSAFVHYGKRYDNAFWDGREMIFGDGDGLLFKSFAPALDVTAHELTHGVTQYEANFIYWKQSGALNESISDVFGSLVKQYQANETAAQANWLMGEQLFTDRVKSVVPNVPAAVRSLKAPGTAYEDPVLGKDPQPRNMSGYVWTSADNGGVHINSGIPNHAFYLAATSIGGYAWQTAGHIWYRALINREIRREAQFADFAQLTTRVAAGLYGRRSTEYEAVRHAWEQVGVLQASESTQTGARRPQALGVHGRWPGRHAAFGRPQPGEHHPVEVKKSS
jgi:Zn-dependent metalloprotease